MTAQRFVGTGTPVDHRYRPPVPIARDDARFTRLPFGDDRVVRMACRAESPEVMALVIGALRAAGWRVHQVGQAMAAHHASGRRWVVGWAVGGQAPQWLDRLPEPRAPGRAA